MRDDISQILAKTPWGTWDLHLIEGDASARRYFRLTTKHEPSLILMDDPARDTKRFADIAKVLTNAVFAAPEIHLHDPDLGLMIISDLGRSDFATHLRNNPQDEAHLYTAATQILTQLHPLKTSLNLLSINQNTAADMIDLAALHYAPTPRDKDALHRAMQGAFAANVDPTPHLALRDFHAENLIWRPNLQDQNRVGLLDFQDSCFAPTGYDLMSLIRDARRDVDPITATKCIRQFCAAIGATEQDMSAHLACVSAQRNLRILGVFARLSQQNGKVKYLSLLPRVWAHLMTDLAHPALTDLRATVLSALPPPDAKTLQRLQP